MSKKKEKTQGPTLDETVIRLETRLREFEDRTAKKIKDLEDLVEYLTDKLTNLHGSSKEESEGTHGKVARLEETVAGFDERMLVTRSLMEQIQEKLYTFDVNKMNNLIFNGVPRLQNENSDRLMACVKNTIKRKLKIIRFIDILNVSRVETGPSVLKCRPIVVTFRHFSDREDVLKASRFLKVSDDFVYITEDLSKKTRECQQELRKFLTLVRKSNPDVKAFIRYDKLFIEGEMFVFNREKNAVELIRNVQRNHSIF